MTLLGAIAVLIVSAALGAGCGSENDIAPITEVTGGADKDFMRVYTENVDFDEGTALGVNHDRAGELRLDLDMFVLDTPYLWAPLFQVNKVVRVDTVTGEMMDPVTLTFKGETCQNPSRTTVDIGYGVWMGCRGGGAGASDRKVIHLDKNGVVDQVFKAGWAARAVALDAFGHLWVGASFDGTVWEFDPQTGDCLRGETTADQVCRHPAICLRPDGHCGSVTRADPIDRADDGTFPYGAMVDQFGYLWIKGAGRNAAGALVHMLYRIDATHSGDGTADADHANHKLVGSFSVPADKCACTAMYGMTIDLRGDIWTGGSSCNDVKHFKNDGTFVGCYQSGGNSQGNGQSLTRGVAVDRDGNIWVADTNGYQGSLPQVGSVTQFDPNGRRLQTVLLESGDKKVYFTTGVGIDMYGNVWAMGSSSNYIIQFNPQNTEEKRAIDATSGMYTYSDMLGTSLRTVTTRQKVATWTAILDSRSSAPTWKSIEWAAKEPTDTSVSVNVRCASERDGLASLPWLPVDDNPDALPCDHERYLQLRVTFNAKGTAGSPSLQDLTVRWSAYVAN
ncbi:MAG: hypothetical protein HY903_12030 [Deltaproteobacteria bacterium]|nr:hypothetical protein [Deltaproteobacteria bacterium]